MELKQYPLDTQTCKIIIGSCKYYITLSPLTCQNVLLLQCYYLLIASVVIIIAPAVAKCSN